jgi:hypothetical protein
MRVSPRASVRDAPAAPALQGLKLLQPYPPIIGEQPYGLHMHLAYTMQSSPLAKFANPSFRHSVLPWTSNACPNGLDPARLQELAYFAAELGVAVEQDVSVWTWQRQCFPQLLYNPVAGLPARPAAGNYDVTTKESTQIQFPADAGLCVPVTSIASLCAALVRPPTE